MTEARKKEETKSEFSRNKKENNKEQKWMKVPEQNKVQRRLPQSKAEFFFSMSYYLFFKTSLIINTLFF